MDANEINRQLLVKLIDVLNLSLILLERVDTGDLLMYMVLNNTYHVYKSISNGQNEYTILDLLNDTVLFRSGNIQLISQYIINTIHITQETITNIKLCNSYNNSPDRYSCIVIYDRSMLQGTLPPAAPRTPSRFGTRPVGGRRRR